MPSFISDREFFGREERPRKLLVATFPATVPPPARAVRLLPFPGIIHVRLSVKLPYHAISFTILVYSVTFGSLMATCLEFSDMKMLSPATFAVPASRTKSSWIRSK